MFESSDQGPANTPPLKITEEWTPFTFIHPHPVAEYYRPAKGEARRPASEAPDRYSLTSEYLVETRDGKTCILYLTATLRVAVEKEAARIRWCHDADRWPAPGDKWVLKRQDRGFLALCRPVMGGEDVRAIEGRGAGKVE